MATLLSPLPSTFSLLRPTTTRRHHLLPSPRRLSLSSRLHSSPFPSDEIVHPALPTLPDPPRTPIFVTLPADAVGAEGRVARRKTMGVSFTALAKSGVEGVVVEVWWGIVEREGPGRYDWGGYKDLVDMAGSCGLKVRAVLCFHQRGSGPGDPCCQSLSDLWTNCGGRVLFHRFPMTTSPENQVKLVDGVELHVCDTGGEPTSGSIGVLKVEIYDTKMNRRRGSSDDYIHSARKGKERSGRRTVP